MVCAQCACRITRLVIVRDREAWLMDGRRVGAKEGSASIESCRGSGAVAQRRCEGGHAAELAVTPIAVGTDPAQRELAVM
jgi:hypothetical protein